MRCGQAMWPKNEAEINTGTTQRQLKLRENVIERVKVSDKRSDKF